MGLGARQAAAGTLLAILLAAPASADVPYSGPLTFWGSGRAPSDLGIVIAGITLACAFIAAGLVVVRTGRIRSTWGRWMLAGVVALGVIAIAALSIETGREARQSRNRRGGRPPPPHWFEPVGGPEFESTGEFPSILSLSNDDQGCRMAMETPFGSELPGFVVMPALTPAKKERGLNLAIHHDGHRRVAVGNALYSRDARASFDLQTGEIVPIYGQLYAAQVFAKSGTIELTRVTKDMSAEVQPVANSRTISLADVDPLLFWEPDSAGYPQWEVDLVRLNIAPKAAEADISLVPKLVHEGRPFPGHDVPQRKHFHLRVSKGGLLTARGRSYKVLNVVPPQEIQGVGRLVGWIEISADPVKTEAEAGGGETPGDK